MRYLVPGPPPCPEVVAVSYIRPAEVPTLFSVEGDAQVKLQNTVVGFLTEQDGRNGGHQGVLHSYASRAGLRQGAHALQAMRVSDHVYHFTSSFLSCGFLQARNRVPQAGEGPDL